MPWLSFFETNECGLWLHLFLLYAFHYTQSLNTHSSVLPHSLTDTHIISTKVSSPFYSFLPLLLPLSTSQYHKKSPVLINLPIYAKNCKKLCIPCPSSSISDTILKNAGKLMKFNQRFLIFFFYNWYSNCNPFPIYYILYCMQICSPNFYIYNFFNRKRFEPWKVRNFSDLPNIYENI